MDVTKRHQEQLWCSYPAWPQVATLTLLFPSLYSWCLLLVTFIVFLCSSSPFICLCPEPADGAKRYFEDRWDRGTVLWKVPYQYRPYIIKMLWEANTHTLKTTHAVSLQGEIDCWLPSRNTIPTFQQENVGDACEIQVREYSQWKENFGVIDLDSQLINIHHTFKKHFLEDLSTKSLLSSWDMDKLNKASPHSQHIHMHTQRHKIAYNLIRRQS